MANRFWEQDSPGEPHSVNHDNASEANELKSLLSSIVGQLADADRRHTAALTQMQDRLTAMSEEAKTLKSRAPEHFSTAFDRIEAGMAELSAKIAETGETHPISTAFKEAPTAPSPRVQEAPAKAAPQPSSAIDHPVALRSATDYAPANFNRHHANVDTFDVIESSMPSEDADLWDQDAADALASVYGSGHIDVAKPAAVEPKMPRRETLQTTTPAQTSSAPIMAMVAPAASPTSQMPDASWLETRFAELSLQLEKSFSGMQSGHVQPEISQRIDAAERNISGLLETVATRTDVEGVRLIEAHVGELVDHLDAAQRQLFRLDAIETQISDLSAKMDEVRGAVLDGAASALSYPPEDIGLLIDKATDAAAQRFAASMPQQSSGDGETRALIERFMTESRQGEENTVALLDTLQQAMIRLLDRVDAMELNQHQALEGRSQPRESFAQNDTPEPATFGRRSEQDREPSIPKMADAIVPKAKIAQTAAEDWQSELAQAKDAVGLRRPNSDLEDQPVARTPDKMRQDFIADARRAKMRLSANGGDAPDVVLDRSDAMAEAPVRTPRGPSKPAASEMADVAQPTKSDSAISTPRLIVIGIAALLATLAGAWYVLGLGNPLNPAAGVIVKDIGSSPVLPSEKAGRENGPAKAKKEIRSETLPQSGDGEATPPTNEGTTDEDGVETKSGAQLDIRGEIIPGDIAVASASVPLSGVAIETANAASATDIQKAKRQQAMAMASSKIGQAASNATTATLAPTLAAVNPTDAAKGAAQLGDGMTSVAKSGMAQSSPLDLPPAIVGPLSLRLAAANGDPSAQFQVGSRLAEGKGNEQNFPEAAKWYQRAASSGFAQAQYRLGTLYERGLGVKADPVKASDWYTKSAELGNVKAMHNLAVMSANQRGSSPDYESAAKWFTQAADRGLSDSQFNLAVLHENGLGVPQDLKMAYKWLAIAARGGDAEAVRRRDILKGKLTADDLAAAEGLAKGWKAKQVDPMINDARAAGEAWKKNPANGVSG